MFSPARSVKINGAKHSFKTAFAINMSMWLVGLSRGGSQLPRGGRMLPPAPPPWKKPWLAFQLRMNQSITILIMWHTKTIVTEWWYCTSIMIAWWQENSGNNVCECGYVHSQFLHLHMWPMYTQLKRPTCKLGARLHYCCPHIRNNMAWEDKRKWLSKPWLKTMKHTEAIITIVVWIVIKGSTQWNSFHFLFCVYELKCP